MTDPRDAHLDTEILQQYCAAIGAEILLKSVTVFEQMAPGYVDAIVAALAEGDKPLALSEAHKLKGAAGSVGLKRIQQLAQHLQVGDAPEWEPQHGDWLAQIQSNLDGDLAYLKEYLGRQC